MSIIAIGINYKTAPVTLREKVYFAVEKLPLYLQDLLSSGVASEAVLISTCNRSELYCEAHDLQAIKDWFCAQTQLLREVLEPVLCVHEDSKAIAHIMEVACGLDSMILGEPQILGQLKEAFSESCSAGAVGASFQRLFQQVFNIAKELRTTTAIGACPVSVASAATRFAKEQLPNFKEANVVLIGAGETSALLLRYLKQELTQPIAIVNRSIEKAHQLGADIVYGLDDLVTACTHADFVFSATGSATTLVTPSIMQKVMQAREQRAITLLDIAVPRDIDPAVAEMDQVHVFCIDDLKTIIEKNRQHREHAALKAQEMIRLKSKELMYELLSRDSVTQVICAYRNQIEEICQAELHKAKRQLRQGGEPAQILEAFAAAFTKKMLHVPSVQMRQAGADGRHDLIMLAKQLFAI